MADLRAYEKLPRPVTLAEMRANPAVRKMKLLKNVRLIVSAITEGEYQELLRMAGIVACRECRCCKASRRRSPAKRVGFLKNRRTDRAQGDLPHKVLGMRIFEEELFFG